MEDKAAWEAAQPERYGGEACALSLAEMMGRGHALGHGKPREHARDFNIPPIAYFWWGCAFKYLWRWTVKGGADDLKKCEDCVKRLRGCVYDD